MRKPIIKKLEHSNWDWGNNDDFRLANKFGGKYSFTTRARLNSKEMYLSNSSVDFFTDENEFGSIGVDKLVHLIGVER